MDEMGYPVLCGWTPAQPELSLTASNAPAAPPNGVFLKVWGMGSGERLAKALGFLQLPLQVQVLTRLRGN